MRILYLNPCGRMGGAETSLVELLASIRRARPEWDLCLLLGEDGPLAGIARELGVRVVVEPFPGSLAELGDSDLHAISAMWSLGTASFATMSYVRRLSARCREIDPIIIHTNGLKMHLLGSWVRRRESALVWHIHDYVSVRPVMSRLLRMARGRCTTAIANSRSVAADLNAQLPGVPVTPIYNAVDFERYSPVGTTLDLDAISGLGPAGPGVVRVGLVGTFARWKGHQVFLEALSRLSPRMTVRGYVIGGPIYQTGGSQFSVEELQEQARCLKLAGKVGFTGFLSDTGAAMRSLDIVVHASTKPEPFGMVIVEAMGCAKPVIVSDAGGASELFEDGRTGLGHEPGNAAALARQIELLACDAALRTRIGRAGRAAATRVFHHQRLASDVIRVYRECLRETGDLAELVASRR